MKLRKLIFLGACTLILSGIGIYWLKVVQNSALLMTDSIESLNHELDLEYQAIKQNLSDIGITDEICTGARNKYYHEYITYDKPPTTKKVSQEIEYFVKNIITGSGLNPRNIYIAPYSDPSPAAATQAIIFINEKAFSKLSEAAKLFVIGHEIQHIINHDNSNYYVIQREFGLSPEKLVNDKKFDHPLLDYSKFIEKRADIQTALRGIEWAEAYYTYAKERYDLLGDKPGTTHPQRSERVKIAQHILDLLKHQKIA